MDLRRIDLNLFVILDALFEESTISAAAHRLGISQPTVSTSLAKIRELFSDEMFVRTNTGLAPTPRALEVRQSLKRMLSLLQDEVLHPPSFDPARFRGEFTIALSDIGELEFVPNLVKHLAVQAPEATMRTVTIAPQELIQNMEEGRIDVALGFVPDIDSAAFMQMSLFTHRFSCVARNDHPNLTGGMSLKAFESCKHLSVSQPTRRTDRLLEAIALHSVAFDVKATVTHYVNVPHIVASTDLVATIATPLAKMYASRFNLSLYDPPFQIQEIEIKMLWHKRFHKSGRHTWLRSLVSSISMRRPAL